ncbi:MAG: phage minor head protein, partial [Faecousia sp.]
DISEEWLADWQQDYSRLVSGTMLPAWERAIQTAAEELERRYPGYYFNPTADAVRAWTANHSAEFVTNVTTTQIEGLRAVVHRAATLADLTVDELARVVRPMIGLTQPQTIANMKYYENLRANGMSAERARDRSIRYAARQHRSRGYDVARTELATAYNAGAYEGAKQAQAAGLLGETVKVWSTALDEMVCPICRPMEGKQVAMDEDFDAASRSWSTKLHPPAHPRCRCGFLIKEIYPPQKVIQQK